MLPVDCPHCLVAVLIPCYNEEATVAKVVSDFRRELPQADVYVYDNASTDGTADAAREAGAVVVAESRRGKGNVVRRMLHDVEADVYVMVDGDDTYPASDVHDLIAPILSGEADMVVGDRLSSGAYADQNSRAFHGVGNSLVCGLVNAMYGARLADVMTGYRAFTRSFAKTYPVLSEGFEVETEMSIHALDHRFRVSAVPVGYRDRPEGSVSKLSTLSDGAKVLAALANLFRYCKPLVFFGAISLILLAACLACGLPVIAEFAATRYITRVPLAIAAVGAGILSALALVCGLVLDATSAGSRRLFELELARVEEESARALRMRHAAEHHGAVRRLGRR